MQDQIRIKSVEEILSLKINKSECERQEKLLVEFEKLAIKERRSKNTNQKNYKKQYERVFRGQVYIKKISGNHIHLTYKNGESFGSLHLNSIIIEQLQLSDVLDGLFGFRGRDWKIQFIFSIALSTEAHLIQNSVDFVSLKGQNVVLT